MTYSELHANEAIQSINRKFKNQNEIDWEERKFKLFEGFITHNYNKLQFLSEEELKKELISYINTIEAISKVWEQITMHT